jgi:hypothetical protein
VRARADVFLDAQLAEIIERRGHTARRVVALEGPVCAGKTTVAAGMGVSGARVVAEYFDVPGAASRVGVDAPAAGDGLHRLRLLLELERRRTVQLPSAGSVVLDRSIFTLVAYEAGLAAMSAPHVLADAVQEVVAAVAGGAVVLPGRVVFLECSAASCRERAAAAGMRTPSFLFEPMFRNGFRELFCRLERAAPGTVHFVDAGGCLAEVTRQVEDVVSAYLTRR